MDWAEQSFRESLLPPKKKPKFDKDLITLNNTSNNKQDKSGAQIWLERFKPEKVEDLIVHKKKIEEVESWLVKLADPYNVSRTLLITGTPGSGKLTTLRVLCKKLSYGLVEWTNPMSSEINYEEDRTQYRSQLKLFAEFVVRATRYKSVLTSANKKRIIVVKELPNVFLKDNALFHECFKQYSGIQELNLVFILSDSLLCRELFPDVLKHSTNMATINFNPITQRNVAVALNKIVKRAGINRSMSKEIEEVSASSNGDMRNAILSLHFLSVKPTETQVFVKPKPVDKKDSKADVLIDHLDMFRGLGRVLYSKKDERGKPVHNPEQLIRTFESCANNFVCMLQQNYLSTFSSIRDASKVANYLATAELMLNDFKETALSRKFAMSIAVHATMLNNTAPVKKFQQLKKYSNINGLDPKLKEGIATHFPEFKEQDFILDVRPHLNYIHKNRSEEVNSLLNKLSFNN